jgi:transposase-like protein
MTNPTKTRRRFTEQQKAEAVALCLSEGFSWQAVAQRLGFPNSSLAKWVRQARIDRGDIGPPDQGELNSDERAELAQHRKAIRELRRGKNYFRLAVVNFAKEQLPPRGFACSASCGSFFCGPGCAGSLVWLAAVSTPGGCGSRAEPGPTSPAKGVLTAQVPAVFEHHRGFYRASSVHRGLKAADFQDGRHRFVRMMRNAALKAKNRCGFRPSQNTGNRASGVAKNLLQQERLAVSGALDRSVQPVYGRLGYGPHHGVSLAIASPEPGPGSPAD